MENKIKSHYYSENLTGKIFAALEKTEKNIHRLGIDDLTLIDQFHTGGPQATVRLMELANIKSGAEILDAGCGIGGSSRLIAKKYNQLVTGIDLSDQFIDTAQALTSSTGLSDQIHFQKGSLLDLPFKNGTFNAILCQQTLMNIQNKEKVFKEFNRVLGENGKLLLHEILKGKNDPIHYPVPWATEETISFLEPWDSMEQLILAAGFKKISVEDHTENAANLWLNAKEKDPSADMSGAHLIFGATADLFEKTMNFNFKWDRIKVVEAVFEK